MNPPLWDDWHPSETDACPHPRLDWNQSTKRIACVYCQQIWRMK